MFYSYSSHLTFPSRWLLYNETTMAAILSPCPYLPNCPPPDYYFEYDFKKPVAGESTVTAEIKDWDRRTNRNAKNHIHSSVIARLHNFKKQQMQILKCAHAHTVTSSVMCQTRWTIEFCLFWLPHTELRQTPPKERKSEESNQAGMRHLCRRNRQNKTAERGNKKERERMAKATNSRQRQNCLNS